MEMGNYKSIHNLVFDNVSWSFYVLCEKIYITLNPCSFIRIGCMCMASLFDKINKIVSGEMGPLGKYVVKKQCKENNINPDNITSSDIPLLADAIYKVMKTFGDEKKASNVKNQIMALK